MKPTPKPSLLMLWIARLYAVYVLGFSLFHLISYSLEQDTAVVTTSPGGLGMTGNSTVIVTHNGPTATLYFSTLIVASLAFGLFMLHRDYGQKIVVAAALGSLGLNFYIVSHFLYVILVLSHRPISAYTEHALLWKVFASSACNVVIQLGNIWLALRPPVSGSDDESHYPPLSSAQPI